MNAFAQSLITTLGGSTAVSRMIDAPITTVQSWKHNGIPPSRLAHLKLVAEKEGLLVDWQTGSLLSDDKASTPAGHSASATKAGGIIRPEDQSPGLAGDHPICAADPEGIAA